MQFGRILFLSHTTFLYLSLASALVLFVAISGLACSIYSVFSCQFFTFSGQLQNAPPYPDTTTNIGLYYYESATNPNTCVLYEDDSDWNTSQRTAQYASVIAPGLVILAVLLSVIEVTLYSFRGSFIIPILLFLLASFIQVLSLFMYGQADFWCVRKKKR